MTFTPTPRNEAIINGFGTAVASSALPATLANSFIAVLLGDQLATGVTQSVTDNLGNTYSMVPLTTPGVSQRHVEMWSTQSASAGVTTITVNNATSVNVAGSVTEWPSSRPVTLRTQASLANSSSLTPAAATVTPQAGELILGCMAYQSPDSAQHEALASGSTYTALARQTRGTTNMFAAAYKIATGTSATGPAWTMDVAVATGEVTAAFTQAPVFTASTAGLVAAFDASASTLPGGDTAVSYAWTFGDGGTGSGVSPNHTYGSAGTKTVTLSVTYASGDTGTTTRTVTVTAPSSIVHPIALISAPGWSVVGAGGDPVVAVSGASAAAYTVSPVNPTSASPERWRLPAIVTPAAGTDFTVTVRCRVVAGTGTLAAKLYQGTTVRAAAPAQTLAVGTDGTDLTTTLSFTFAAADIANITSWNGLDFELIPSAA